MNEEEQESFMRWFLSYQLSTGEWLIRAFFKNAVTMLLVSAYIAMLLEQITVPDHFHMLLGMIMAFYFNGRTPGKAD